MSILFPHFPKFLAAFVLITIFRNVHRPCNQSPNIISNSEHHPLFFSDFITILQVKMQNLPHLEIFRFCSLSEILAGGLPGRLVHTYLEVFCRMSKYTHNIFKL